jgi:hypothetical protein
MHATNLVYACKLMGSSAANAVLLKRMLTLLRLIDASADLLANELGAFPADHGRHQEEQLCQQVRVSGHLPVLPGRCLMPKQTHLRKSASTRSSPADDTTSAI